MIRYLALKDWKKDCNIPYRNDVCEDRRNPSANTLPQAWIRPKKHDSTCHLWTIPNAWLDPAFALKLRNLAATSWSDPAFALKLRNLAATSADSIPTCDKNYRIRKPSLTKSCRLPSVRTLLHSEWYWLSAFDILINVLTLLVTGDLFKPWGTARNGVVTWFSGSKHQEASTEDRSIQHRISVDLLACSVHLYCRVLLLKW
jgi:hypothetical protein